MAIAFTDPHLTVIEFLITLTPFRPDACFGDIYKQCRPVKAPQTMESDQKSIYSLLTGISMQNTVKVKIMLTKNSLNYTWTLSNDKDGQVQWSQRVK